MAEIVVGAIINVFCEKLTADLMNLARSEGIESQLKKWKKTLPLIQAVLDDACQKQIKQRAVQLWLNDLQDLAYDIDDVLDDLATEALRRKLNQDSHASTSSGKVLKFIPTCCSTFTPSNIMYGQKMKSKLDEITTKLDDLFELKSGLGLNVNVNVERSSKTERQSEETSLVDESKIMGREGEKNVLLEKLLRNDENVSIVSIVGMGGIGKTTLAKVLYNQEKVKDHFELRAWVCVSDEFNVFNISNAIFQAVDGRDRIFSSLNILHEALKEKLLKKKFLLVLDDVWNEDPNEWERLESPLVGAPGSKILVTTRNMKVTSAMDVDEIYHLKLLSYEDALSVLAHHALIEKNFDKHPTLKVCGEKIVKKCGRLPLALKMLGKVLKGNTVNDDEWEKLLNSEIWDIHDNNGILPALRLSYYHLPPHLKLLFAYYSLFPKDYVFYKNDLVLLWMAEGFLSKSKCKKSMESLGPEYFEELESKSFFQHATDDQLRYLPYEQSTGYSMHDLINDLATSVAGEFLFRLDDAMNVSNKDESYEKFRHFSLIVPPLGSYEKLKHLRRARGMRTLLPLSVGWQRNNTMDKVLVELLLELQFLRVLSLANRRLTEVPESIGSLKHLRYLNFSKTRITCLPEQVGELYNLQSLLVHDCWELFSLPKSFKKLTNMRHLDITDTPKLKQMPLGIGGLTNLQTLPKVFITKGAYEFRISELKGLLKLQGRLSLMGLDKVVNPIEAMDANLHQKKGLDVLEMIWSDESEDSRKEMTEYEVLEALRPHDKLRVLKILCYKGTTFPKWVGNPSFDLLTELELCGCRCKHLPTLGHLHSLKTLVVERMNEVTTVGFELLALTNSSHDIAFPSLKVLKFDDMQCWERWSTSGGDNDETIKSFPCLREISIKHCPKLSELSIALIPSLQVLDITECSETVLRSMIGVSSSLVRLVMLDVKGLTQLNEEDFMHLGALQDLLIRNCDELRYLSTRVLVSLQSLDVGNCKKVVSLGEEEVNLESLKKVEINSCDMFKSYNCSSGVEELQFFRCGSFTTLTFSTLPSSLTESIDCQKMEEKRFGFRRLRYLQIRDRDNFYSFPHKLLQSFTSLEELEIIGCPRMDSSFPRGLWPPNISILKIGGLKKPMSEWGLQNFPTSLVDLCVFGENSGITSFAVVEDKGYTNTNTSSEFHLPPSLVELTLVNFEDVESLSEVLQRLRGLKRLSIKSCPKLKDLPQKTSDPSSLTVTVWK